MHVITLEKAKQIIEEFGDEENFINYNYQMRLSPYDGMEDNSIDLAIYYRECERIVKENNQIL